VLRADADLDGISANDLSRSLDTYDQTVRDRFVPRTPDVALASDPDRRRERFASDVRRSAPAEVLHPDGVRTRRG
jgi:hypothetical protein